MQRITSSMCRKTDHAAFEDVDAAQHLGQAVPGAALHRGEAEGDPFVQDGQQVLLLRPAVAADHGQVDRDAGASRLVWASSTAMNSSCGMRGSWVRA
jgi:hypothetical protein